MKGVVFIVSNNKMRRVVYTPVLLVVLLSNSYVECNECVIYHKRNGIVALREVEQHRKMD